MKTKVLPVLFSLSLSFASLSKAQENQIPSQLNMGLEHMTLTKEEVAKRDKILKPIYDNYENVNLSSVANALESAYGLNVYHHFVNDGDEKSIEFLTLKNKKAVMENAVRYFFGYSNLFDKAPNGTISFPSVVAAVDTDQYASYFKKTNGYDNRYYMKNFSPVSTYSKEIQLSLIEGDKKHWRESIGFKSPSVMASMTDSRNINDVIFGRRIGTRTALFSTVKDRLFTAPVMVDFTEAMKNLNIKAIDATVTFVSGSVYSRDLDTLDKYRVIYPAYSKTAPIPQPVILISENATYNDMVEMLNQHAPKIYAYNKLFNKNLLPSVAEINAMLDKYPEIIKEVEKTAGKVRRENLVNAAQAAFLNVTYGTAGLIAAPIAIGAMAASAALSPIFVTTIIVLL